MKVLLDGLLPRFFPDLAFLSVPHEGKHDLEKSIPIKVRAWNVPGDRFVIVRDNDGRDCLVTKAALVKLCRKAGRTDSLVRIACQELEAWYLGEPDALAEAFDDDKLHRIGEMARYREPDAVQQPSAELVKLVPEFQKVSGARRLAPRLTRERNVSQSFHALIDGIERIVRSPNPPGRRPR